VRASRLLRNGLQQPYILKKCDRRGGRRNHSAATRGDHTAAPLKKGRDSKNTPTEGEKIQASSLLATSRGRWQCGGVGVLSDRYRRRSKGSETVWSGCWKLCRRRRGAGRWLMCCSPTGACGVLAAQEERASYIRLPRDAMGPDGGMVDWENRAVQ